MTTNKSQIESQIVRNIRQIMFDKGVKQRAIAKKADMLEGHFSAMLNGRKIITAAHIPPLARALEVTPNDLFEAN